MDIRQSIYESTLYIHRMYDEPITVMEISEQTYLSLSYFSSIFRTLTDYSVKNYLNRYRLYRAAMELKNSKKQIVEIAFTRSFSQMYGITPEQFRLLSMPLNPFPPENLWKEQLPSMELMECFKNVSTLANLPVGLVGLRFDTCDFAVFDTTLAIIWTGDFWRTFYSK